MISFTNAFIDESLNKMKYLFQIEKKSKDSLGFLFWFCLILFSFIGIKIVNWMLFFSFDPDNDPMCVLLMIDFYALRASEYSFLIRMFQEWEVKKLSWGMKICLVFWIFTLYVWCYMYFHSCKQGTIFIVVICYFLNR